MMQNKVFWGLVGLAVCAAEAYISGYFKELGRADGEEATKKRVRRLLA